MTTKQSQSTGRQINMNLSATTKLRTINMIIWATMCAITTLGLLHSKVSLLSAMAMYKLLLNMRSLQRDNHTHRVW